MKKLITIIFLSLICFTAFSEDFTLFPWFCDQKDIYSFCMNKNWQCTDDSSKNVKSLSVKPSADTTFKGSQIYMLYFQFDNSGKVVSQNISLKTIVDTPTALAIVLELAVNDNATFENKEFKDGEILNLKYSGRIRDLYAVDYVIVGQNNSFQISISYHTY